MEEIIRAFYSAKEGKLDNSLYKYDNILVSFSGMKVSIFNSKGDLPFGQRKLPATEEELIEGIRLVNDKVGEFTSNNQYICFRCKKPADLPVYKRDINHMPFCKNCSEGKPPKPKGKNKPVESKVELTEDKAIEFLKSRGYVIRKIAKKYKVVYEMDGKQLVSDGYYKTKDDFTNSVGGKFISFIKELYEPIEEDLS